VLEARRPGTSGTAKNIARQDGGVIWYPVREATFLKKGKKGRVLTFSACVLHGQQQLANGAAANLNVLVPAEQSTNTEAVGVSGSAQAAGPMPGRLQLPGLWREVACLKVTVGTGSDGRVLRRAGDWGPLQHLEDHYMLALSAVSGGLLVSTYSNPHTSLETVWLWFLAKSW
jgi:hypothetical protein